MLTINTRESYYSKTGVSNIYTSIRNHVVTQVVTERVNWELTLWSEKSVLIIRSSLWILTKMLGYFAFILVL